MLENRFSFLLSPIFYSTLTIKHSLLVFVLPERKGNRCYTYSGGGVFVAIVSQSVSQSVIHLLGNVQSTVCPWT